MNKALIGIFLILAFVIFTKQKDRSVQENKEFFQKCLHPTVLVCNAAKSSGGSGFIVRSEKKGFLWRNIVLGAAHTVIDNEDLVVKVPKYRDIDIFKGYQEYDLSIYAMNIETDMFIGVFASTEPMPTVELDTDLDLKMRMRVFHVGYGLFDDIRFDAGEITQPSTIDPFPFRGMIRTNAFTFSGDSGGPLFSEKDFKVIGLCHGIRKKNDIALPHMSYYKPIKDLVIWNNDVNNSLNWVYKNKEPIPVLPFLKLNIKRYEFIPPR